MRVNDVSCNCPEYGGQVRHNTGCPLGGWHPSQTMGTTTRPMPRTEALAWCNRDDYGWCGHHNRPFGHCRAEALDTVAAERERITREVSEIDAHWGMVERAAVLAIVNREDTDA